jgi:hypothetical protein
MPGTLHKFPLARKFIGARVFGGQPANKKPCAKGATLMRAAIRKGKKFIIDIE